MKLVLLNNNKKITSNDLVEPIEFAIIAFLTQWAIQNEDATITIEFDSKELPDEAAGASRMEKENDYHLHINKNAYFDIETLYVILAHEIVHIKQYHRKELITKIIHNDYGEVEREVFWKGKNISNIDYDKAPHEKEAYQYQSLMMEELFKEIDMLSNLLTY